MHRTNSLFVCLLALSLLASGLWLGVAPAPVQAQGGDLPVFEPDACPFDALPGQAEGSTYECGYLIVPEDRADPNSPEIALLVVTVFSHRASPLPDPVIYLEGGPGGSAVAGLESWLEHPFLADRDIILIDQRGTGFSEPVLNCPEYDDMDEDAAAPACYARLVSEGINVAAYNSRSNAADIADLRLALGYDAVNLYGTSYGTRLALNVMREFPAGVRSVILEAVYPPQVQPDEEQAANGALSFERLFTECAADAACNAAYPDLEGMFYDAVAALNASPEVIAYEGGDEEVTGDMVIDMMFQAFYDLQIIPSLPLAIALLDAGYVDVAVEIFNGLTGADLLAIAQGTFDDDYAEAGDGFMPYDIDSDAEGMFNAVTCNEEVPFETYQRAEALTAAVPPLLAGALLPAAADQFAVCAVWDAGVAAAVENTPVVSSIPTLVVSGDYDPITPPAWGQLAADHLANSTHVVLPGVGHGAIGTDACADRIAIAFVNNPQAAPDVSCVAGMGVSFFVPPLSLDDLVAAFDDFYFGDDMGGGLADDGMEDEYTDDYTDEDYFIDEVYYILDELGISDAEFDDFLAYNDLTFDELIDLLITDEVTLDDLWDALEE